MGAIKSSLHTPQAVVPMATKTYTGGGGHGISITVCLQRLTACALAGQFYTMLPPSMPYHSA